jgi:serine/threonine protein kinase
LKAVRVESVQSTAFSDYTVHEALGEGGAGRVFGGKDDRGVAIAIKILVNMRLDARKRFKNEAAFLMKNMHSNIVTVLDHGVYSDERSNGPFYVMRRYDGNLRARIGSASPQLIMQIFWQILDGVEAAHSLIPSFQTLPKA